MPRIITDEELKEEGLRKTCRCTNPDCRLWIRFMSEEVIQDNERRRRYLLCPSCNQERCLGIWSANCPPPERS